MNEETGTHLDLFSGIGGFALAARWAGYRTIAFCEQDRFCQGVLERHWPDVPITDDVHDLDGRDHEGVTLLTGGFPCQPFSTAGKRRGEEDDRALWPQMARVIDEARPTWVLGENVAGLVTMGIDNVLSDLEGMGYAVQTFIVPACAVDAPHRRDRIWIVGNAEHDGSQDGCEETGRKVRQGKQRRMRQPKGTGSPSEDVAHADGDGACRWGNQLQVLGKRGQRGENFKENRDPDVSGKNPRPKDGGSSEVASDSLHSGLEGSIGAGVQGGSDRPPVSSRWLPEPDVGRVAHGIPNRVDRLKGLGNAIVPQVAYEFIRLMT